MTTAPAQSDVDTLRHLLDIMCNFTSNDQRARFLLSSDWIRDRDAELSVTGRGDR